MSVRATCAVGRRRCRVTGTSEQSSNRRDAPPTPPPGASATGPSGRQWRALVGGHPRRVVSLLAFEAMAVATAMPVAVRDLDGLPFYALGFSAFLTPAWSAWSSPARSSDRRGPVQPFVVAAVLVRRRPGGRRPGAPRWGCSSRAGLCRGSAPGSTSSLCTSSSAGPYPDALRPRLFSVMASAWVIPVARRAVGRRGASPTSCPGAGCSSPSAAAGGARGRPDAAAAARPAGARARRGGGPQPDAAGAGGRRRDAGLLQYAGQRLDGGRRWPALAGRRGPAARRRPAAAAARRRIFRLRPRAADRRAAARGPRRLVLRGRGVRPADARRAARPGHRPRRADPHAAPRSAGRSAPGSRAGPALRTPRWVLVHRGSCSSSPPSGWRRLATVRPVPAGAAASAGRWPGWAWGSATSHSVLVLALSPVAEQGANSAALQLSDALGSILLIGAAGAVFAACTPRGRRRGAPPVTCDRRGHGRGLRAWSARRPPCRTGRGRHALARGGGFSVHLGTPACRPGGLG